MNHSSAVSHNSVCTSYIPFNLSVFITRTNAGMLVEGGLARISARSSSADVVTSTRSILGRTLQA